MFSLQRYAPLLGACLLCLRGVPAVAATAVEDGGLSGVVRDALGQPVAGAHLDLEDAHGRHWRVDSDAQGRYQFDHVPAGRYRLHGAIAPYGGASAVLRLREGATLQRSLTLQSQQPLRLKAHVRHLHQGLALNHETGTSDYHLTAKTIDALPQGQNTSFNQVLLQAPGVVQDSYGQVHVRGEHADLQYRIDGFILPGALAGFGQAFDTRFADRIDLLTGTLPAAYGERTAAVVDIHTHQGQFQQGGDVGLYVGSYQTENAHAEWMGHGDHFNAYVTATAQRDNLGIDNPTASVNALHDHTHQGDAFAYLSWDLPQANKLVLIAGTSSQYFQIPNVPGQTPGFALQGVPAIASTALNDQQYEQMQYVLLGLQGWAAGWSYQADIVDRYTAVQFAPGVAGDLIYNGVSSAVQQSGWLNGLQVDAHRAWGLHHQLQVGTYMTAENLSNQSQLMLFPANAQGQQSSDVPYAAATQDGRRAYYSSAYVEDRWRPQPTWTVNYGLRFDELRAYAQGNQISPRINIEQDLSRLFSWHAGYARYFMPPTTQMLSSNDLTAVMGSTNQPDNFLNGQIKPERDDSFDIGGLLHPSSQWSTGLDAYYKRAHDLIDEGQFGAALLYTPFNYSQGKIYGLEWTNQWHVEHWNAYFNAARSSAFGRNIVSSQYTFNMPELGYIQNHWIHLDHDQTLTASGGLTYTQGSSSWGLDMLAGSGLRRGFANTGTMPGYTQWNLSWDEKLPHAIDMRWTIINLFDHVYELRDGSGVGVGAPQFGPRRGFYWAIDHHF